MLEQKVAQCLPKVVQKVAATVLLQPKNMPNIRISQSDQMLN